jgi:Icc-related predicted phosphoesterase
MVVLAQLEFSMRILCVSDLHQKQNRLELIPCDVLIIAGDVCSSGEIWQLENFVDWLKNQSDKFNKAILVAGNHDFCFMKNRPLCLDVVHNALGDKAVYLEDSSIEIDGIKFYGSPWQPEFNRWAFNVPRGERLKNIWSNIPDDVHVLITHGPPHGIGDLVDTTHAGCMDLLNRVTQLKDLFLHVFGHIHSGNGHYISDAMKNVNFCNAAVCDERYDADQASYLFTLTNTGPHHFITCEDVYLRRIQS